MEWNKKSGVDPEKAKKLQAGFTQSGAMDKIKSAWTGLKTSLQGNDKKSEKLKDKNY